MNAYRDIKTSAPITASSFTARLRTKLDERIRIGRDGMDLNAGKKGMPANMIYRNYFMSERVFDLGCKLAEIKPIEPQSWVNWMIDAEIIVGTNEVNIYCRNGFFCDGAQKRFGAIMAEYFKRPVEFVADQNIEFRIAA